jgi:hypothetical protein
LGDRARNYASASAFYLLWLRGLKNVGNERWTANIWLPPFVTLSCVLISWSNTCPQVTELGAFAGPSSTTEDCLYLNVFTTGNLQPVQRQPYRGRGGARERADHSANVARSRSTPWLASIGAVKVRLPSRNAASVDVSTLADLPLR